jgi:hypothetical protein
MATAQDVTSTVNEIQAAGDLILQEIQALDPAVSVPANITELLLDLASKAVAAWSSASATPVTIENLQTLLPNQTPLSPPTA